MTWLQAGGDLHNTRSQCSETLISSSNVDSLSVKWEKSLPGDVSATPTSDGANLYFPDWSGNINALSAETGTVVWQHSVSDYVGTISVSRTSPAIMDGGKALVIGDRAADVTSGLGANVIKIDAATGEKIWLTNVDSNRAAIITASPAAIENVVIVGVSSGEEGFARDPAYPCCTFRGSVVALDGGTGAILWKTFMVPDNAGVANQFSGAAVMGSSPMIDKQRGLVYVGTGNNYSVPQDVANCLLLVSGDSTCGGADNRIDSVVALDIKTGAIRWTFQAEVSDIATNGCIIDIHCGPPKGADSDFAQPPVFVRGNAGSIIFAGEKSGFGYGLDPDSGKLIWKNFLGSGMMWGSATDGARIYVATRTSLTADVGSWVALDPTSGNILWITNIPGAVATRALGLGPVTVANGVVYAGSVSKEGPTMYGLDAKTGEILFSFDSGSPVAGGAAILDGVVYWGSGYPSTIEPATSTKMFAFHLPDSSN